ncbi:uncharacterized protein LOC113080870 [Carassius auratus]|uniref:Uncharacterized protein LOC113080870 n=1 Tax=Carassius auratus TaxID=7957 RepID=A0A6P6NHV0_CARAU|nr:uncharacterized protein LOC113080870 [Carassius auratus]
MVERWPALFTERQVFAEFNRIASKNLEGDFFEALDQYTPRFIKLFKTKKGTVGQKLRELIQHISCKTPDVTVLHSVVLKGIPILLCDESSEFYKTCSDTTRDEALECITVGVLKVVSEDSPHEGQSSVDLQPISTAIILEGGQNMDVNAANAAPLHTRVDACGNSINRHNSITEVQGYILAFHMDKFNFNSTDAVLLSIYHHKPHL